MTISITEMIAGLEAKIAAADSNTSTSEILNLLHTAEELGGGHILYDSAAFLPTDSAHIGTIRRVSGTGHVKAYNGTEWIFLDSAAPAPPWSFQGSSTAYQSGGSGPSTYNTIDKWPFANDENATDVGDLTVARQHVAGHSSSTHGSAAGGYYGYNTIDNFPFAAGGNASDVGDLTVGRTTVGHSSQTDGYTSGGTYGSPPGNKDIIDKFPFASGGNATDVGDMLTNTWYNAGISSQYYGYITGGNGSNNVIQKFSVTADANATDVGDLTVGRESPTGTNSDTHGYSAGGTNPDNNPGATVIDKFPFATDANATDVGDVTNRGDGSNGQSSNSSGYLAGGYGADPAPAYKNIIEKYSFSSDANATDVGDLTQARWGSAGQQV